MQTKQLYQLLSCSQNTGVVLLLILYFTKQIKLNLLLLIQLCSVQWKIYAQRFQVFYHVLQLYEKSIFSFRSCHLGPVCLLEVFVK